jgi:hypothetical protein
MYIFFIEVYTSRTDDPIQSDLYRTCVGAPSTHPGRTLSRARQSGSRRDVFYIGFDNGGSWRSTNYRSKQEAFFDRQSANSIGTIAWPCRNGRIIVRGSGRLAAGSLADDIG